MERIEATDIEPEIPAKRLQSAFEDAPVQVAILFGSRATGMDHAQSDIDIAVEFDGLKPGDPGYNETFFGLGATVSELLDTDDIDLVDVHSLSPSLAQSVFTDGLLLVGRPQRVEMLRASLLDDETDEHSATDRFDKALRRIDEHLA